jgi:predicted peroxiredoxin
MGRLLVHIATGTENVTRVTLGMLVARTALAGGHDVDVFLAGDGVSLLRDETLDAVTGVGTGSLREHFDALVAGGAGLYASGLSAKARGIDLEALKARGIAPSPPDRLVELTFAADRVLTY